jgi:hypothetical protein
MAQVSQPLDQYHAWIQCEWIQCEGAWLTDRHVWYRKETTPCVGRS